MKRKLPFSIACVYELALLALALLWGWFFHEPTWRRVHWNVNDCLIGGLAAVPLLLFFVWTLKSEIGLLSRHRQMMESLLLPLFGSWSILQLAVISLIAGISEEALFRGAIQASLSQRIGSIPALALAAVLFGVSHLITWTYAIIATVIGLYLGLLWIRTGNLLTPIGTHAVYDFLALLYFLKIHQQGKPRPES